MTSHQWKRIVMGYSLISSGHSDMVLSSDDDDNPLLTRPCTSHKVFSGSPPDSTSTPEENANKSPKSTSMGTPEENLKENEKNDSVTEENVGNILTISANDKSKEKSTEKPNNVNRTLGRSSQGKVQKKISFTPITDVHHTKSAEGSEDEETNRFEGSGSKWKNNGWDDDNSNAHSLHDDNNEREVEENDITALITGTVGNEPTKSPALPNQQRALAGMKHFVFSKYDHLRENGPYYYWTINFKSDSKANKRLCCGCIL
ncbi:hypothetical protein FQA39_LY10936 [Lamprigera yunnana]|nr:hypothetical protein FQA39_LY10936 [Lamprigera yunnana]